MTQSQFDQLLAWTTLNALSNAVLVEQRQLERPLTEKEFENCHKRTHKAANAMTRFYAENRKKL